MLQQEQMIARVRGLCTRDERLEAAMMYGSFTYDEGDVYSDIEFLLFFDDDAFEAVDPCTWLAQIAPVELLFVNHHGIHEVIFDNLIRGEFHFHRASEVTIGAMWPGMLTFPSLDATLIVDKSGLLTPYLEPVIGPPPPRDEPQAVQGLLDSYISLSLFGFNVLQRGERARALELLGLIHRHLLQMVRLLEGQTQHWLTPSRAAEADLSSESMARFAHCVAASLAAEDMARAYHHAWGWGGELMHGLRQRYGVRVPDELCRRITEAINRDRPASNDNPPGA